MHPHHSQNRSCGTGKPEKPSLLGYKWLYVLLVSLHLCLPRQPLGWSLVGQCPSWWFNHVWPSLGQCQSTTWMSCLVSMALYGHGPWVNQPHGWWNWHAKLPRHSFSAGTASATRHSLPPTSWELGSLATHAQRHKGLASPGSLGLIGSPRKCRNLAAMMYWYVHCNYHYMDLEHAQVCAIMGLSTFATDPSGRAG